MFNPAWYDQKSSNVRLQQISHHFLSDVDSGPAVDAPQAETAHLHRVLPLLHLPGAAGVVQHLGRSLAACGFTTSIIGAAADQCPAQEHAEAIHYALMPIAAPLETGGSLPDPLLVAIPASAAGLHFAYQAARICQAREGNRIGIILSGCSHQRDAWRYFRHLAMTCIRDLKIHPFNLGFLPDGTTAMDQAGRRIAGRITHNHFYLQEPGTAPAAAH